MLRQMLCSFVLLAVIASTQGRAVNINNTWVLPEEGFPVFYRYFRDRISWYEADAVCQFHHANLVTVDTTAQYDAVRAYLKELDISSAVWVGLIRSNPDGDFTWTDYRGMSNDGYWSAAPDARAAPLCAAADPAADYRWQARACGGPGIASFICELPVPQWALGNSGCMVKAIPALTVLYLPESAAVQLTADCGMTGVKRVQCTGNVKKEDLLKNLSCAEDNFSTVSSVPTLTSTTVDVLYNIDEDTTTDVTADENVSSSHETISSKSPTPTSSSVFTGHNYQDIRDEIIKLDTVRKKPIHKNINLDFAHDNNLQSNDIPTNPEHEDPLMVEQTRKLEDEKNYQHKLLHDELAKHGNFETIFSQSSDHFVPPLVMAKSKINDDMMVLSLAEKHAQQIAEQRLHTYKPPSDMKLNHFSTDKPEENVMDKPLVITILPGKYESKKDKTKLGLPKKYLQNEKYDNIKSKSLKIDNKLTKFEKNVATVTAIPKTMKTISETSTIKMDHITEDPFLELTVNLKEPDAMESKTITDDFKDFKLVAHKNESEPTPIVRTVSINENGHSKDLYLKLPSTENITMTNQVIKITLINDDVNDTLSNKTVFEITTRIPEEVADMEDFTNAHFDHRKNDLGSTDTSNSDITTDEPPSSNVNDSTILSKEEYESTPKHTTDEISTKTPEFERQAKNGNTNNEFLKPAHQTEAETATHAVNNTVIDFIPSSKVVVTKKTPEISTETPVKSTELNPETPINKIKNQPESNQMHEAKILNDSYVETKYTVPDEIQSEQKETKVLNDDEEKNSTENSSSEIDDFQSPLLSSASQPLHRPNRSRRPQLIRSQMSKFNPFRILG